MMKILISMDEIDSDASVTYLVCAIFRIIKAKYSVKPYLYKELILSDLWDDLYNDRMEAEFTDYVVKDTVELILSFIKDKEDGNPYSLHLSDYTILSSRLNRISCITKFLIKEYHEVRSSGSS